MPHSISALVVRHPVSAEALERFDLCVVPLPQRCHLLWLDHHYTEHWSHVLGVPGQLPLPPDATDTLLLPHDRVLLRMVTELTGLAHARFAVIWTDYFGGFGHQCAVAYDGERHLNDETTINAALEALGVVPTHGRDAFDTIGLSRLRCIPDHASDKWAAYPEY